MNYFEKIFHRELKTDILILAVIVTISTVFVFNNAFFWHFHIVYLVENQILYIFSVLAQIVGALIGISVAAYALLDSRFNSIVEYDDTLKEIIPSLRKNQFWWLLHLVSYGLLDIVLCLSSISIYTIEPPVLFDILSDASLIIFFIDIYILIRFTLFLSPDAQSLLGNALKKEIEDEYSNVSSSPASFAEFITKYNQFEELLYSFLDKKDIQQYQTGAAVPKINRHNLTHIDEILRTKGIFNNCLVKIYNDIRKYRNALVHGTDDNKEVNADIYNKLFSLYELLKELQDYIRAHENEDYKNSLQYLNLLNFSLDNALSDSEKETIKKLLQSTGSNVISTNISGISTRGLFNIVCDGVLDDLLSSNRITHDQYLAVYHYYLGKRKK